MTSQQPQPARQLGLNKRSGSVFGLQAAPAADEPPTPAPPVEVVAPAPAPTTSPPPAATAKIRSIAPPPPAMQQEEPSIVRIGLYLKPSVADAAQSTMAAFGAQNAAAIRRRGARRNSLNAFLTAVLEHALENFDQVDPADIVRRMPTPSAKHSET